MTARDLVTESFMKPIAEAELHATPRIDKEKFADEQSAGCSSSVNINSFVENLDQSSIEESAFVNSSRDPLASILPFPKALSKKIQQKQEKKNVR